VNHELCYTSAPRGLYPGSRGFCTVKATRGIPLQLRETLETLSSYKHKYPPNHPQAASNPVNFMNVGIQAAGKSWMVLSRVQAAGLDHTNRSNFFAHHIAMEKGGLGGAGPAWLLRQPNLLQQAWDNKTGEIDSCRPLPNGAESPRACRAWAAVTGDAGWAGVVANHLLNSTNAVYLVYEEKTATLPLISEVLALLPENQRWNATFSTYFSSLAPSVNCRLRCVLRGSPEERMTKQHGVLAIDLARAGQPPEDNPGVELARAGQALGVRESKATPSYAAPTAAAQPVGAVATSADVATQPSEKKRRTREVTAPPPPTGAPMASRPADYPPTAPPAEKKTSHSWAVAMPLGVLVGALIACLVTIPIALWYRGDLQESQKKVAQLEGDKTNLEGELKKTQQESQSRQETIGKLEQQRDADSERISSLADQSGTVSERLAEATAWADVSDQLLAGSVYEILIRDELLDEKEREIAAAEMVLAMKDAAIIDQHASLQRLTHRIAELERQAKGVPTVPFGPGSQPRGIHTWKKQDPQGQPSVDTDTRVVFRLKKPDRVRTLAIDHNQLRIEQARALSDLYNVLYEPGQDLPTREVARFIVDSDRRLQQADLKFKWMDYNKNALHELENAERALRGAKLKVTYQDGDTEEFSLGG